VQGYNVVDHVRGSRLEIRNGDQRIVVDRKRTALYVPCMRIVARYRARHVYVLMGDKQLELTTPIAVKVGFALAKNGGACMYLGDVVTLEINGDEFHLLPSQAVQLGGVMLKKADRADDWQLANPIRRACK
jgi:hypothetical protein